METLGMFAKFWQPGRVMTRLAASIGEAAAAGLYREFLATLIVRLADVADTRTLVYAPAERQAEFQSLVGSLELSKRWQLQPQAEGDLGNRLRQHFHDALAAGADRVVVVGSDSPSLPLDRIDSALRLLDQVPLILGPAADGGYYLIAARGEVPPVFDGIPWSTGDVLAVTIARARQAGWRHAQLEPWYDIDTIDDLKRLREESLET